MIAEGFVDEETICMREETMEYETLLNAEQVARMMGLSIATIRRWVLTGYIPYKKIGRSVRFSAAEIKCWTQSKSVMPSDGVKAHGNTNEIDGGKNDENNE